MALTAKQQRRDLRSINESIAALRLLAMHTGLIAPCAALAISNEEKQRRIEQYGLGPILYAIGALLDKAAPAQQKAACAVLLECFIPDWRDMLGPAAYGAILDRDDALVRKWRAGVLERDSFTCQHCGSKEHLHAHHIVRWADCPELRVELTNGLTLCQSCHVQEHAKH